jgi:hypothetical protein
MKEGRKKAIRQQKSSKGQTKNPSQFYKLLWEAFCLHSTLDPETAENQRMTNAVFVSQAQGT